jgi:hypothetical protein
MKYKIILKTSHKHVKRVESCLKTWLKDLDYVCLTDKPTGLFNEISGSKRDDYYSNEEKTITLINVVRTSNIFDAYDWLVFLDDDAYLNVNYFNYLLPYLDKKKFYGLAMGGYPRFPNLVFPSGGAGYMISVHKMKKLSQIVKPEWSSGGTEDVIVGNWLEQNHQKIHQEVEINGQQHHFPMNGWWPFHREKELLNQREPDITDYKRPIIERYVDGVTESFLKRHLTHHYITEWYEMLYVHSILKDWKPEYL